MSHILAYYYHRPPLVKLGILVLDIRGHSSFGELGKPTKLSVADASSRFFWNCSAKLAQQRRNRSSRFATYFRVVSSRAWLTGSGLQSTLALTQSEQGRKGSHYATALVKNDKKNTETANRNDDTYPNFVATTSLACTTYPCGQRRTSVVHEPINLRSIMYAKLS